MRYYRQPIKPAGLLSADWTYAGTIHQTAICIPYSGTVADPEYFDTANARNVTYSAGVNIGPSNVSAQSGYGSNQNLRFSLTQGGFVCGNDGTSLYSSSVMDSQATR